MKFVSHPNQRTFSVRFLSPTNHRGARVKITDLVREESVTLGYDYAIGCIGEQAASHLLERGIDDLTLCVSNAHDGYFLSSPNFANQLKGNPIK